MHPRAPSQHLFSDALAWSQRAPSYSPTLLLMPPDQRQQRPPQQQVPRTPLAWTQQSLLTEDARLNACLAFAAVATLSWLGLRWRQRVNRQLRRARHRGWTASDLASLLVDVLVRLVLAALAVALAGVATLLLYTELSWVLDFLAPHATDIVCLVSLCHVAWLRLGFAFASTADAVISLTAFFAAPAVLFNVLVDMMGQDHPVFAAGGYLLSYVGFERLLLRSTTGRRERAERARLRSLHARALTLASADDESGLGSSSRSSRRTARRGHRGGPTGVARLMAEGRQPVQERFSVGARVLRPEDLTRLRFFCWGEGHSERGQTRVVATKDGQGRGGDGGGHSENDSHLGSSVGSAQHRTECEEDSDLPAVEEEDVCAICLEPFRLGERVVSLQPYCSHYFHAVEAERWLCYHSASCPYCRAIVDPATRSLASDDNDDSALRPGWLLGGAVRLQNP